MCVFVCRIEGSRMIQIMLLKSLLQVSWFVSACCLPITTPLIHTVHICWCNVKRPVCLWTSVPLFLSLSGNSRVQVYKYFDSSANVILGSTAVLYSDGGCGDPSARSWYPHQHHRSPWQPAQILPCQVCLLIISCSQTFNTQSFFAQRFIF